MSLPTLRWSLPGVAFLASAAPVPAQPAPVVVQPAPVVVQPAPVVVQPAPVVVQPAPEEIVIVGHYCRVPDNVDSASVVGGYADLYARDPQRFAELTERIARNRAEIEAAELRWLEVAELALGPRPTRSSGYNNIPRLLMRLRLGRARS